MQLAVEIFHRPVEEVERWQAHRIRRYEAYFKLRGILEEERKALTDTTPVKKKPRKPRGPKVRRRR